jgi:hypothetical protein
MALSSSSLSWANVAASVSRPPTALFFVVVVINPANASNEIAKMTKEMRTSMSVKPFDFKELFILAPPLKNKLCKRHTKKFEGMMEKNRRGWNRKYLMFLEG